MKPSECLSFEEYDAEIKSTSWNIFAYITERSI